MTFVLAIDQGTTSSRAILFRPDTSIAAVAQREFPQHFPASGWVEHEPEDLWSTTIEVCRSVIAKAGVASSDIAAIGITNQRETTVVWDRDDGQAIHRAIVWQDRRTADLCAPQGRWQRRRSSRPARDFCSIRISRARRSHGSSTMCRARERGPSAASWPSAPSTASCSGV